LIKESTGELVHIDFGIVFEQGKVLPTPEKIPFRLTRDMIDGMVSGLINSLMFNCICFYPMSSKFWSHQGPMGTEGVFTSAARATTKVLRENSSSLLTVLSAVVSDPLYKWNVSTAKGRQLQRDVSINEDNEDDSVTSFNRKSPVNNTSLSIPESDNDAATRAVARINEKLKGYEEGPLGEQQTIDGQVRFLINEASNADHLCSIFSGWGAWI
jgi:ataxia telangiectasia mutated family protein